MVEPTTPRQDGDQPEYRVGRKQPGNLYRNDERFGFTIRDVDGPLVADALNAYMWPVQGRGDLREQIAAQINKADLDRAENNSYADAYECADAALSVVGPLLATNDAEIARLRAEQDAAAGRLNELGRARAYLVDEIANIRGMALALISRLVLGATGSWDPDASIEDQVAEAEARIAQLREANAHG